MNSSLNKWLTYTSNWNQVCNSGMVFGALAIRDYDKNLSDFIINRSIQSIKLAMPMYNPDGNNPEGYTYWSYGTTYNSLMIDNIIKNFGKDFGLFQNFL